MTRSPCMPWVLVLISILLCPSCSPPAYNSFARDFYSPQVRASGISEDFSADGIFDGRSLDYTFDLGERLKNKTAPALQDVINYIYFEGDTIVYSLQLEHMGEVEKDVFDVYFMPLKHPDLEIRSNYISMTKNEFTLRYSSVLHHMERTDWNAASGVLTGFSLVGTVMEKAAADRLQEPYAESSLDGRHHVCYLAWYRGEVFFLRYIDYTVLVKK